MIAALMSPSTRKTIAAIATGGEASAIASVHPREKKQPPVSCVRSCSRRSFPNGQLRWTTGESSRAQSALQPTAVMVMHMRMHIKRDTPAESRSA